MTIWERGFESDKDFSSLDKFFGVLRHINDISVIYVTVQMCRRIEEYKKRLLLRCIHHFISDLINNMDHIEEVIPTAELPTP